MTHGPSLNKHMKTSRLVQTQKFKNYTHLLLPIFILQIFIMLGSRYCVRQGVRLWNACCPVPRGLFLSEGDGEPLKTFRYGSDLGILTGK